MKVFITSHSNKSRDRWFQGSRDSGKQYYQGSLFLLPAFTILVDPLALSPHSCKIAATIADINCSHDNIQLKKNGVSSMHRFLLR